MSEFLKGFLSKCLMWPDKDYQILQVVTVNVNEGKVTVYIMDARAR